MTESIERWRSNNNQRTSYGRSRFTVPIAVPLGRLLVVLIYARYSTDEQSPTSIDDQVAFCKRYLESLGISEALIIVVDDRELSGELVSRPGIDLVREKIANGEVDVVLAEDTSRFFRNPAPSLELFSRALDCGVRVIGINDDVDSADVNYMDRLLAAQQHHSRCNRETSERIIRSADGRWENGAAVGPLRPGYTRRATYPATEREPARGPFFDEVDPQWSPTLMEMFERVANLELPEDVGRWLTQIGLPKPQNSARNDWTAANVIALIRHPVYRGQERFRETISRRQHSTGAHLQVANNPDEILWRDMRHLQIVPDWLWQRANDAINARNTVGARPRGADHPLHGVPRDTRGPLPQFTCSHCGGRMVGAGRNEGGYRCGSAQKGGPNACWSRATALRSDVHEKIGEATITAIDQNRAALHAYTNRLRDVLPQTSTPAERVTRLERIKQRLQQKCRRLTGVLELCEHPPAHTIERLNLFNLRLARVNFEIDRAETEHINQCQIPVDDELDAILDDAICAIEPMDRNSSAVLRRIVPNIEAFACQQFNTNAVRLRARFELNLSGVLPATVQLFLNGLGLDSTDSELGFGTVPVVINLFEPSLGPKFGMHALELRETGIPLKQVGIQLGFEEQLAKRRANIAIQYGRAMREAGICDPFIELTEPPANASRWRNNDE